MYGCVWFEMVDCLQGWSDSGGVGMLFGQGSDCSLESNSPDAMQIDGFKLIQGKC